MTMEDERELDMKVAELELENKNLRIEVERITRERDAAQAESRRYQEVVERIMSVSRMALWGSRPQGTCEVGPKEHRDKASY